MVDAQFFNSFRFNLFRSRINYSKNIESCPLNFFRRIKSGSVRILTEDIDLQLKEGDIFFIPKGLKYRVFWTCQNGRIEFPSFGFTLFPLPKHTEFLPQKLACTPEEAAFFLEMEQTYEITPSSVGNLYRFMGAVLPKMIAAPKRKSDLIIDTALAYMNSNLNYTMADVARHCKISESNLFIKFRNCLGKTPVEIRHEILCDKAQRLLATTDFSIEEISEQLGFSSSSYFRKVLKSTTGKTPTQIRRGVQNDISDLFPLLRLDRCFNTGTKYF